MLIQSEDSYSAPPRYLLRGALRQTPTINSSFQMIVKVYAESLAERTRRSEEKLFHVVVQTTEKARRRFFEVRAEGTRKSPRGAKERFPRPARPEVFQKVFQTGRDVPDPDRNSKFNALGNRQPVERVGHTERGMITILNKAYHRQARQLQEMRPQVALCAPRRG